MGRLRFLLPALILFIFFPPFFFADQIQSEKIREGHLQDLRLMEANRLKAEADEELEKSKYREAAAKYEESLKIFEQINDKKPVADGLYKLGRVSNLLGRYDKAMEFLEKALEQHTEMGDKQGAGSDLTELAAVEIRRGQYDKSLALSEQALGMYEEVANRKEIAITLRGMAEAYRLTGEYSKALQYGEQSAQRAEEIGDKGEAAYSFIIVGLVHWNLGNYLQALGYYRESLKIFEEKGDKWGVALGLINHGIIHWNLGNYAQALEYYRKGWKIFEERGSNWGVALSLNSIAVVYKNVGNYGQALEYFQKALKMREEMGEKAAVALSLDNIGSVYQNLGAYAKALEYHRKAWQVREEIGDKRGMAMSLDNMGTVQYTLGDHAQALEHHRKAGKIFEEIGDKWGMAISRINLGWLYYKRKEMVAADRSLSEAIRISKQISSLETLGVSLHRKGLVFRDTGRTDQSISLLKEAIQIIEQVRGRLEQAEHKAGFFQGEIKVYEDLITLLATAHNAHPNNGHDREAFYYAERAKARAFLDLLEESRASVNISEGIDQDLLRSEREFEARLSNLRIRLDREHSKPKPDKNKTSQLEREQDEVYRAYEELKNEMRKRNPRYAELKYPKPSNLAETQKLLDNGSVLLEYLLGKEASFLFAITKSNYRLLTLPGQEEMERLVAGLRKSLQDSSDQSGYKKYAGVAYKLHSILIKPANEMLRGKRRIIISADGYLHYLPFEALLTEPVKQDSAEGLVQLPYLIKKYEVSYIPSASVLHQLQTSKKSSAHRKELLVFADPIYPSEKLRGGKRVVSLPKANSRAAGEVEDSNYIIRSAFSGERGMEVLTRLAYSGKEALAIASIVGKTRSDLFLRERATEDNLKYGVKLDEYKIVHFAAHGIVNENKPQFSAVVLTQQEGSKEDGYLQMYEVFNLNLNADLVVLSACKSGLGKRVDGEGLVGLTRAFMYAGAASLVVSLWDTQDRATSEFMKHFYSHLKSGKDKAEALRLAKLEMTNSPRPLWRHPFYWAAFVLVGNVN